MGQQQRTRRTWVVWRLHGSLFDQSCAIGDTVARLWSSWICVSLPLIHVVTQLCTMSHTWSITCSHTVSRSCATNESRRYLRNQHILQRFYGRKEDDDHILRRSLKKNNDFTCLLLFAIFRKIGLFNKIWREATSEWQNYLVSTNTWW